MNEAEQELESDQVSVEDMERQMSQSSQTAGAQDIDRESLPFKKVFRDARLQISVGLKLHQSKRTTVDGQFLELYTELNMLIDRIEGQQQFLMKGAPNFDFINPDGSSVKANGYRSLLNVLKSLLTNLVYSLQKYARERSGKFFNPAESLSNMTSYTRALQGMDVICHHAIALMTISDAPTLYNNGDMRKSLLSLLFTETARRDTFYGRCLGFQYCQGLKPILQFLAIAMASYEDWYKGTKEDPVKQLLGSLLKGGKYIQHPTQRGIKIAELTEDSSIYFTKAFWSITEQSAITAVVKFVSQSVDVSETLEVPAKNIKAKSVNNEDIVLQPPFSDDIGYRPISVTLISHKLREGQKCSSYGRKQQCPCSSALILHFHGGGFVAQSSKSHEFYLRSWSREFDCPILSVDYSLAPEATYPRPVDECVFVYAWTLNNFDILGTTGEKIILAGDSAGGYMAIVTAMRIKQLGLRPPDEVFSFYPPTLICSAVSPSRFLSLMDPLLPIGIILSCLQAYTGNVASDEVRAKRKEAQTRILSAKGHIIPTLNDPYVTPKPQTKWEFKLRGGLQRSQTLPSDVSNPVKTSAPSKPTPPRPPPPKTTTPTLSFRSKPARPPPPKSTSTKRATNDDTTLSSSNDEMSASYTAVPEEVILAGGPTTDKRDSDSHEEPNDLVEVDLNNSTDVQTATAAPVERSVDDSCLPVTVHDQNDPLLSVAPFFPKQQQSSSSGLRFGMKVPTKNELMSDSEIDALVEKMLETFEDTEIAKTDPFISPVLSPDHLLVGLPPINIVVCSLDPLMDDGIMMAQRLKSIGQPVTLTVMENLSHGFLCLTGTEQINIAHAKCSAMIKKSLKL